MDLAALTSLGRHDLRQVLAEKHPDSALAHPGGSRGQQGCCTFCSIHQIYGDHDMVRRSRAAIASEMEYIKETLVDARVIAPPARGIEWVNDFCDLIDLGRTMRHPEMTLAEPKEQQRWIDVEYRGDERHDYVCEVLNPLADTPGEETTALSAPTVAELPRDNRFLVAATAGDES
ncbi:hypothetical protein AB0K53_28790 [Streptomyces tuirus]|uniref:hypothetical protein n=1 Tax=Streptomyces tuirus TaxID=68278 RepID=UPI00341CFBD6